MAITVLGISAFYHDAAAAIVRDGEIVAAAQEERFSRRKHDPRFPRQAINYCLEEAFVEPGDLDAVAFYDNPLLSADRVLKSLLSVAPQGEQQWLRAAPVTLGAKLFAEKHIRKLLPEEVPIIFTEHHLSHASSAFYPSPFRRAAILTLDGVGEWTTTAIGRGEAETVELLKEITYPHSLGLLYSAFTYFCGFEVNSGEYKLMGLAPYGQPVYADLIRDRIIDIKEDGSFHLNMEYFGFLETDKMTNESFDSLFGGPPRAPEERITRREMDLAASIQRVVEDAVLALARHARKITEVSDLVLAGGVALNCVANGRLQREKVFDRLWIQPAAGDAGGALGAALLASYRHLGVRCQNHSRDSQRGSYLGPAYSSAEVRAFLDREKRPYRFVENLSERMRVVAEALAEGHVVGYFAGRMEYGPRALGARSILGDPRRETMQATMNLKIKNRESFRPFAPVVLAERCGEYFTLDTESPYMLLVAQIREERRRSVNLEEKTDDLLAIVNQPRSDIPAVTHVDYSARVQTVSEGDKIDYYELLKAFDELTGCGVLVNTSFNVRDEPIVCSPRDAYRCFMQTEMDMLVLEDCILLKREQSTWSAELAIPVDVLPPNKPRDEKLARFFQEELTPVAIDIRQRGIQLLPGADTAEQTSYYRPYMKPQVNMTAVGQDAIAHELAKLWTTQGLPDLASLAGPLMALATELAADDDQDGDLSPFIYAMF